jgi:hypothetical protein
MLYWYGALPTQHMSRPNMLLEVELNEEAGKDSAMAG